ncbi:fumarylacetoacetase [Aliidongia dinghuensis]|uniref:fumarylacetoacetase n=1 Tax=Aliidongia dinghuensis TaxID=1867774 RepID=A0A8J2YZP3_9PROT|nr:fumarylacetoacetase [Aliidongia dinghuensis]GGF41353.1 fumarylacetoacetase [Aliidongia dinghuensis]
MSALDQTHDRTLTSWVTSANGHADFPIQNLPFGIFQPHGGSPRGGVAIGDEILDLREAVSLGLFEGPAREAAEAASGATLNPLMAVGAAARRALRLRLSELLAEHGAERAKVEGYATILLHQAADCTLHLPARIGDYTDFYAGINHATNVGRLFRPDNPLMPNYKYVPIGYHGRASSVRVSGGDVVRPNGQRKPASEEFPSFGPSRNLDYELELGIWIGPGNALSQPIPIAQAAEHIVGYCLLNDWSARDIQGWEYQPLGPFLAKNFHTSISPWLVTAEALAPFRSAQPARPEGDPRPMDYLWSEADQQAGALDIRLDVLLETATDRVAGRRPVRIGGSNTRELYWTPAQMVAHHASGGCNLAPGDLFGSGTISGTTTDSFGSLLEITEGGRKPLALPAGETRRFLEDGDEVIFRAHGVRDGFVSIGFGECRGRIAPAI